MNSKVTIVIAFIVAIANAVFSGRSEYWALPVIIAITASPVLRPNRLTLLLAVCVLSAITASLLMHKEVGAKVAFICAVVSMIIGLYRWKSNSIPLTHSNR